MQTTAIITESLPKTGKVVTNKIEKPKTINGNYIIIVAIVVFCCLISFLGFPFWAVVVFGVGMSFILFLLYVLRGIQITLDLNQEELEKSIKEDLF